MKNEKGLVGVEKGRASFLSPEKKRKGSLLVFWPLAGAWGAGELLPRCAQLLWCELHGMKDLQKRETG